MIFHPDKQATCNIETCTGKDDPGCVSPGEVGSKEGTDEGKSTYGDVPECPVVNVETESL
jgi:hypothetical protein